MANVPKDLLRYPGVGLDSNKKVRPVAIRDYRHASNIFTAGHYNLAPKLKFLFHVYFEINKGKYAIELPENYNLGVIVKTIKLPSYQIQTNELNQYNRKRIVQSKIKYDNVDITWHDDHSNLMNKLWFNYYTYYYGDSTNKNETTPTATAGTSNPMTVDFTTRNQYRVASDWGERDWGYTGELKPGTFDNPPSFDGATIKPPFFRNIHVYGFSQHKFIRYTLVNPIIASFGHDTYAYSEGNGTMENRMTIMYEFVKYFEGEMNGDSPEKFTGNFGTPETYDRQLSPYVPPGNQSYVTDAGVNRDPGNGNIRDLATGSNRPAAVNTTTSYNSTASRSIDPANRTVVADTRGEVANSLETPKDQVRNQAHAFPVWGQSGTTTGTAESPTAGKSEPEVIEPTVITPTVAGQQPVEQVEPVQVESEEEGPTIVFNEISLSQNDPALYEQYKAREQELYEQEKEDGQDDDAAKFFAKQDAQKEFAERASKVGAAKIINSNAAPEQQSPTPQPSDTQPPQPISTPTPSAPAPAAPKPMPNWEKTKSEYKVNYTPASHLKNQYPGIEEEYIRLAQKYPPRTDLLQSIESHEQKLIALSIKSLEDKKRVAQ